MEPANINHYNVVKPGLWAVWGEHKEKPSKRLMRCSDRAVGPLPMVRSSNPANSKIVTVIQIEDSRGGNGTNRPELANRIPPQHGCPNGSNQSARRRVIS